MLFLLLTIYAFKLACIFVFVVYCIIAILMIMYNVQRDELRKCVVAQNANLDIELPAEGRDSVDDKLEVLTEKLTEKERALRRSQNEIKNAERVLSDLENKTSSCRDRYRSLMSELKKDILKTEDEARTLQNQISNLSIRREALRTEVLKQQEDYQKILNNFTGELETKRTVFSADLEKSRHPRVSCPSYHDEVSSSSCMYNNYL